MGDDFPRCDRCHENPMSQTWTLRGMGPIIGDMQWRLCDECADLGTANGKLTNENKQQADRIAVLELQIEDLKKALHGIGHDPHCDYFHESYKSENDQYRMGCADGHRCAATKARKALGEKVVE